MKARIVLAVFLILAGCQVQRTQIVVPTPVIVEVTVEPYVEPTATPVCQHAEGVTLEVHQLKDTSVELRVNGLQAGEKPSIIYSASVPNVSTSTVELYDFAEGADEHGGFTVTLSGLRPLEGETSSTWDIRFIHAHGVECTTITLP